ncbi:ribosome-associated heat shock protein Hsp15 [Bisgaard Taxon 45]|uniref:Heat shock protein 15 n=1 Tax=Bisgaard Taxon 45 TaxID=304289 RepID=A0ABT9KG96_9PAST|nr:ribosome-associated heat shock protein Hsp15 [Bisgaard Taxon 45]
MAKKYNAQEKEDDVRLDKWLWAARFYKTRTLAKEMIEGGKVHYNGQRTKPNKTVEIGGVIKLRQGNEEKEVEVVALSTHRRGAPEAQLLYQETEKSIEQRAKMAIARKINALTMPHPDRRPNKKERRDLLKFKHQDGYAS